MLKECRQAALFAVVTMVMLGGGYHGLVWSVGRLVFPSQAEGSLIRRADGSIVGSRLIAQQFEGAEYFHPRPSAVAYNAASAGGSNLGPSNLEQLKLVQSRIDALVAREGIAVMQIPSEMVTASGAGLDPHIPPLAAELQAPRIARARHASLEALYALIASHTEPPVLGLFGRVRVNVLELNVALDEQFGASKEK